MTTDGTSIKAVAFDLDGLMFNTEDLYDVVSERFLSQRGHRMDARLTRQMMGRPAKVAVPLMIEWFKLTESFEQIMTESDTIFDEILPSQLRPMPGLNSLLDHLAKVRMPVAIATSSRLAFVRKLLEISRLPNRFEFFLTSESITNGKPDPEIYLNAAKQFGVEPHQMAVFEDSEVGCKAAITSGAFSIAVPTTKSRDHCFDGAKLVCDSLNDERIYQVFQSE